MRTTHQRVLLALDESKLRAESIGKIARACTTFYEGRCTAEEGMDAVRRELVKLQSKTARAQRATRPVRG